LIPGESPGFSLVNNLARGNRLVSRFSHGGRIGYELLHKYNFPVFNHTLQFGENCSMAIDEFAIDSSYNYFYQEHPLQVTYTAALFYLFQNAKLNEQLPEGKGDSLAFLGNQELIDVAITLPVTLFALACFSCAVVMGLIVRTLHQTANRLNSQLLRQPKVALEAYISEDNYPRKLLSLGVQPNPSMPPLPFEPLQVNHVEFEHQSKAHPSVTFHTEPILAFANECSTPKKPRS
jgi:hypothetical protein